MTLTEVNLVQAFYHKLEYKSSIHQSDTIFLCLIDQEVVGAVRIRHESGMRVLRGMQVELGHQRQGIGSRLISLAVESLGDADCFCFPYAHLKNYYAQFGFEPIALELVPPLLQEKYNRYCAEGLDLVVMYRIQAK